MNGNYYLLIIYACSSFNEEFKNIKYGEGVILWDFGGEGLGDGLMLCF